ncbi:TIGR01244 family sulfur transferase [uncultured Sphingomonas sp.]|uniref:TIGR01244 family sulfur transferase n=1 Tax=uncultured Sphingomonas sp. TaxID=158754 RepID=UPI0035CA61D2
MLFLRPLNDRVAVAPQIDPEDMAAIKAAGFVAVVNNRPDDEEPGQPGGEAIRAAAAAAGLGYQAIPVTHAGFSHPQLDAMAAALAAADGPVLAYCRSGTRSCNLWALAAAKAGRDPALLVAQAAAAGYDLSGLRPTLDALSASGVEAR